VDGWTDGRTDDEIQDDPIDLPDEEGPPVVDLKKVFKLTHFDDSKWIIGNRVYFKAGVLNRGGERHKKQHEPKIELFDDINDVAPTSSKPPRSSGASSGPSSRGGSSRGGRGARGKARGGTTIAPRAAPSDDDILFGSVIRTTTFVDVKWQDESVSENIRSTDLLDYSAVLDTDFWVNDFVEPIDKDNYPIKSKFPEGSEIVGLVRKFDSPNRLVLVDWFVVGTDPQKDLTVQELASAYDVTQKDEYNFNLSTIVRKKEEAVNEDFPDWVGEVIAFDRGHISVRWADGSKTTVLPHQISVIDLDDLENDQDGDDEDGFEGDIMPIGERFEPGTIQEIDDDDDDDDDGKAADAPAPAPAVVAEGDTAAAALAADKAKEAAALDAVALAKEEAEYAAAVAEEEEEIKQIKKQISEMKVDEKARASVAAGVDADAAAAYLNFPPLVVLDQAPVDFLFPSEGALVDHETIQKIQSDLQKIVSDLPDRTFLRLFQSEIGNMQLLVIGADETPFSGVPFIFDIQITSQLMNEGVLVALRSDALGPILPVVDADGRICIDELASLPDEESEDDKKSNDDASPAPDASAAPASDAAAADGGDAEKEKNKKKGDNAKGLVDSEPSLYDLVIYIQGILLGSSMPYSLEPSVERFNGSVLGRVNGALYNEISFLNALDHTIRLLSKNDSVFSDIISAHLTQTLPKMLERVRAFLVWYEQDVKPRSDSFPSSTVFADNPLRFPLRATAGFVQSLTALLPRLEAASAPAPASA